jgi:hypothetical protein
VNVFDIEAIPHRWLVAVFGDEEACFFATHPEHIPGDVKKALAALFDATCIKLPRSA